MSYKTILDTAYHPDIKYGLVMQVCKQPINGHQAQGIANIIELSGTSEEIVALIGAPIKDVESVVKDFEEIVAKLIEDVQ